MFISEILSEANSELRFQLLITALETLIEITETENEVLTNRMKNLENSLTQAYGSIHELQGRLSILESKDLLDKVVKGLNESRTSWGMLASNRDSVKTGIQLDHLPEGSH